MATKADWYFGGIVTELAWMIDGRGRHSEWRLRTALDSYIDSRIAAKVPNLATRSDVTPKQDDGGKQAVADFGPMMSSVQPTSPTAREVHEAWRRWNAHPFTIEYLGNGRYERVRSVPPPSFPELET